MPTAPSEETYSAAYMYMILGVIGIYATPRIFALQRSLKRAEEVS